MKRDQAFEIIARLLEQDHKVIAYKLGLIYEAPGEIPQELIIKAVGVADRLSRVDGEKSKQIVLTICALLWTYCKETCSGLSEALILFLARIGFSPSGAMVDPDYKEGTLSAQQSYINQHAILLHHLRCEISIGNQEFILTEFQKHFWDSLEVHKVVGISAPTSAGKSYVILLKCIHLLLERKGVIIYIVPTLSLVAQVSVDFREKLDAFGMKDCPILTTFNDSYKPKASIYVLTQEKAIASFSQSDIPFSDVRMLVVDEVQNVERVGNDNDFRSKILFDAITDIRFSCDPDYVVISGPRVDGLGDLGIDLIGIEAEEQEAKSSPVSSITYAIAKSGDGYSFKQYHDLLSAPFALSINNEKLVQGFGKSLYSDEFHEYLNEIIARLGEESKNIVFAPTALQARKTALAISSARSNSQNSKLESLVAYIRDTVHPLYDLADAVEKGVAFHHGKMPMHIRRAVEHATHEKLISNVVCTTTLMQGVNLPAQNVIIRSPNLFVRRKGDATKLTNYELANLRGRAGRLLKDFIGRTFILDESFFSQLEDDYNLLQDESKKVTAGYSDKFFSSEAEICNSLIGCEPFSDTLYDNNFLLTYIRHGILRHKDKALYRFKKLGIEIAPNVFAKAVRDLDELTIDRTICFKNRYWDPFDLQRLADISSAVDVPIDVFDRDAASKLVRALNFMKFHFSNYSKRHYEVPEEKVLLMHCINAVSWAREDSLCKILSTDYHSDSEKIDKTITLLLTKLSYGIPALLKPLYDIKFGDSCFLRAVECGAYRPITRVLIENNVPRDTAISLVDSFFPDSNKETNPVILKQQFVANYKSIPYWERVQLRGFLN